MGAGCFVVFISPELLGQKGKEDKDEETGADAAEKQARVFLMKSELVLFLPVSSRVEEQNQVQTAPCCPIQRSTPKCPLQ